MRISIALLCVLYALPPAYSFINRVKETSSNVSRQRRYNTIALWASKPTSTTKPSNIILHQKVVRPVNRDIPIQSFLGHLIDYLENFEPSSKLPMVYQSSKANQETQNDRLIVSFDSPLSPDPKATKLNVEVIGIFANNNVPTMAMVVVSKQGTASNNMPPMLQNLFKDSEEKIIQALDRGLDDLCQQSLEQESDAWQEQRELIEELLDIPNEKETLDVTAEEDDETPSRDLAETNALDPPIDFAVEAAREAARKRSHTRKDTTRSIRKDAEGGDKPSGLGFAVQAAKEAARKRKLKEKNERSVSEVKSEQKEEQLFSASAANTRDVDPAQAMSDYRSIRPPILNTTGRKISTTISRPRDYKRRKDLPKRDMDESSFRKTEEDEAIIKSAWDALQETVETSEDLSPEELLNRVMNFESDDAKEKEPGAAFASSAFEKAKDILRQQRQQVDKKRENSIAERIAAELVDVQDNKNVKYGSVDEELRQMFEAGQNIAESRMTLIDGRSSSKKESATTEEDVDALIRGEKSVSSYARRLDEELVELEAQINRSPDELFETSGTNPVFDIFTGPETYNPNVDPLQAMNWPGADRGAKELFLPKELEDARRQAEFAVEVLGQLQIGEDAETGQVERIYKEQKLSDEQYGRLKLVAEEAIDLGLVSNPLQLMAEESRLQMILDELWSQPEDRVGDIIDSYKDLLLSDNFVKLVRKRMEKMAERDVEALRSDDTSLESQHARERELLGQLVVQAQLLLKETQALGAELEARQLEVIRSICKVAMDPSHETEEAASAALTDAVRDMRPLFDDAFVAYLKYAIAEEKGRLAREGVLDDPEHNQWYFVLQIVQQGVYAELSRTINRYIDHIWYILRMETSKERYLLLKDIVDAMPSLDVKPFVQVVENIASSLGEAANGDFDAEIGELTTKILQLRRDVNEILPPERIASMSKEADDWAKRKRAQLAEQREITRQRLKASTETEHVESKLTDFGIKGEYDRMD